MQLLHLCGPVLSLALTAKSACYPNDWIYVKYQINVTDGRGEKRGHSRYFEEELPLLDSAPELSHQSQKPSFNESEKCLSPSTPNPVFPSPAHSFAPHFH